MISELISKYSLQTMYGILKYAIQDMIDEEVSISEKPKLRKLDRLYEKYMHDEKMRETKKIRLLLGMIENAIVDEKYMEQTDEIYKKLLNSNEGYSFAEVIFLFQYTTLLKYKYDKYDENDKVNEGYEDFELPKLFFFYGRKDNSVGVHRNGRISIDVLNLTSRIMKKSKNEKIEYEDIVSFIRTINHEMQHHKQKYESTKNIFTKRAYDYIKREILGQQSDEYNKNYAFKEIEIDAELESCIFTLSVLSSYVPEKIEDMKDVVEDYRTITLEDAMPLQHNDSIGLSVRDRYNILSLIDIIQEHPEYLDYYPMLKLFFKDDGRVKGEKELLIGYKEALEDDNIDPTIYHELFVVMYEEKEDILMNVDMSDDLLQTKYLLIKNLLIEEELSFDSLDEITEIDNPMRQTKEYYSENMKEFLEGRKRRIVSYQEFLATAKKKKRESTDKESKQLKITTVTAETLYTTINSDGERKGNGNGQK